MDPSQDPKAILDHAQKVVLQSDGPLSSPYMKAVDSVQHLLEAFTLEPADCRDSGSLDEAQNVLQLAMSRMEDEFRNLLEVHSESVDPEWLFDPVANPSFGSVSEETASRLDGLDDLGEGEEELASSRSFSSFKLHVPMLPPEIVSDLSDMADRMIRCGYRSECCQGYIHIRKAVLEECVLRLGVEKFSIEDVQKMTPGSLETEIVKWMKALKVSVGVLFPSEKQLCEQVFAEFPAVSELCFVEVGKGAMLQLLNFAEAVAIGRRSPEKLPRILDMYELLRDLLAEIDLLFSSTTCANMRSEASDVLKRLGEAARGTFTEFANLVKRDTAKNPVPFGAVHPLTRYVMNYLRLLSCFSSTLDEILGEQRTPSTRSENGGNSFGSLDDQVGVREVESPLSVQTLTLLDLLEDNIEGKAQLYKDSALSYLFLMNNYQYIVQKVKASEMRTLLSDDWLRRRMSKVRQSHNGYLRAAWTKVLACLRDEGLHSSGSSFSSGVSRTVLKERFKAFNAAFEETVKTQQNWIVSDSQLCADLRISIIEMVLPAYRNFLGRFQNHIDSEKNPGKFLKYSPENLEGILNDLFDEATSVHRRRSLSSS